MTPRQFRKVARMAHGSAWYRSPIVIGLVPAAAGAARRVGKGVFASGLARVGAVLLLIHALIALAGVIWSPAISTISGDVNEAPTLDHPFGTDHLGRDVFTRLIAGSAKIVGVSFGAALCSVILGAGIGAIVAWKAGNVDALVMRGIDVLLSFPMILVALLSAALLPQNYASVLLVVAVVQIPWVVRVARAIFGHAFAHDYVTAAILRREAMLSIVVREALPNAAGPLLVEFALRWNFAVILIASLNFLGVGVQPPTPDWGLMLFEARNHLVLAPWTGLAPALAIASLAVAINFAADGLSTALAQRTVIVGQRR